MADAVNTGKATQAIRSLLDHLDIKHVVSVDDEYAAAADKVTEFVLAHPETQALVPQLGGQDLTKPRDVVGAEVGRRLAGMKAIELEEAYQRMKDAAGNPNEGEMGSLGPLIKNPGIKYEELSLAAWKVRYPDPAMLGIQGKALVLFDQSFEKEGQDENAGIREVKLLMAKTDPTKVLTGLLTNKCKIGEECHRWEDVARDEGLDRHRFLYIAKERLDSDVMGFALMLKLTALSPRCAELLDAVCKAAGESFEAAVKSCKTEVSVYDFEHIVFVLSRSEGVWEPETVLRMLFLFLRMEVTKRIRGTDKVRKLAEQVRTVSQFNTDPLVKTSHTSWKLQQHEMYDSGEYINKLHLPLELGDVFVKRGKTGGRDKHYAVIAQPCDLMVRGTGKRGGRCAEEVVLCEIEFQQPKQGGFKLPYWTEKGEAAWVNLASRVTVNPCMLDLAVFDADGATKIGLSDEADDSLIPAWRERFEVLLKQAKKIFADFEALKKLNASDDLARLVLPSASLDGKLKPTLDRAGKSLDFGYHRMRRIRQPWSAGLLKEFAAHLAREAYEMDLGQELHAQPAAAQAATGV